MAIFASTTTSGYSDPLKAYSIKALEQRQKDMMAQQATQEATMFTPQNTQTPIQGVAQVANVAADAFRQKRVDDAAAAGRSELSGVIAQGPQGPNGEWSPQQQAVMSTRSPDMYKEILSTIADRRKQEALFGQQDKARAEDARIAREAAIDTEQRLGNRPASDAAKIAQDVQNGKLTAAQGDALIKKLSANSPSEEKLLIEERNKAVELQSNMQLLDEAHGLINSPKGIHSGNAVTTPLKTAVGSIIPQSLGGPDDETQKNTQRFNLIMKSEGLQQLLKMKGASSDRDVQENFKIANDPSQPLDSRKKALSLLRDALYTHVKTNKEDVQRIGGEYPQLERAPGSNTPSATPAATGADDAARQWLKDNPTDPRAEAVRKKLEGK